MSTSPVYPFLKHRDTSMGWTHSWKRGTELPAAAFAQAVEDCRKAITAAGGPVAGFDGTGEPILGKDAIIFNGKRPAVCETFEIHQTEFDRRGRKVFWGSCKTEHAPYDLTVKTCLVVLKRYLGDAIKIAGDGADRDWDDARKVCQDALGFGADFRLDPPEAAP